MVTLASPVTVKGWWGKRGGGGDGRGKEGTRGPVSRWVGAGPGRWMMGRGWVGCGIGKVGTVRAGVQGA